MKKHSVYLALLSLLLFQPAHAELNILACEPEWASLAHELTGDLADISSATTAYQDPHHIQARPSLQAKARKADLLVCSGSELEIGWLPLLLRKTGNPKIQMGQPGYFMATEHVHLKGKPKVLDRSEGDIHAAGNPHIQTSPQNILPVARAMTEVLTEIDTEHAQQYLKNFDSFSARWKEVMQGWKQKAAPLRGKSVITYHKNWIYLEDWLGLKEAGTLEDKPGIPPTSGHLSSLLQMAQSEPIQMIIYASYQDPKAAEWFSERSGIPAVELPATVGGAKGADDLFGLYEVIIDRMLATLK
jgi:zinc/manganese transport system substrate-binding protein